MFYSHWDKVWMSSWWFRNKSLLPGERAFSQINANGKHFFLKSIIVWAWLQSLCTPKGFARYSISQSHKSKWSRKKIIECPAQHTTPPPHQNTCFLEAVKQVPCQGAGVLSQADDNGHRALHARTGLFATDSSCQLWGQAGWVSESDCCLCLEDSEKNWWKMGGFWEHL